MREVNMGWGQRQSKPPKFPHHLFKFVNWDAAHAHAEQFEKPMRCAVRRALNADWIIAIGTPRFDVPGVEIELWRKPDTRRTVIRLSSGLLCCANITATEFKHAMYVLRDIAAPYAAENMKLIRLLPNETHIIDERLVFRLSIADYFAFLPAAHAHAKKAAARTAA